MSVETAVESAVAEVEAVAKKVEEAVLGGAEEAKTEAVAVEQKAVAEVEGAKTEAVAEAKKPFITLEGEEKFVARDLELEYLKATMEIQRLQKITEEKAKAFQAHVDALFIKYGVSKAEYVFDATKLVIMKIGAKL